VTGVLTFLEVDAVNLKSWTADVNTQAREVIYTVSCIALSRNMGERCCVSGLCSEGVYVLMFVFQFM
jgi:hypothetical protein